MLKTACLALALLFVTAQGVSWADCCCGSFCQHKNTCTGCPPGKGCPGGKQKTEKASCCGEDESAPRKTCSHLEPSSEIDTVSADAVYAPPSLTELMAPPDLLPVGLWERLVPPQDTGPPRAGPSEHLPLYLSLSALRI